MTTSFRGETVFGVAKWRLFSQAKGWFEDPLHGDYHLGWVGKKIQVNSLYLQFDNWMLSKEQRKLSEKMIYRIKYIDYM